MVLPIIPIIVGASALGASAFGIVGSVNKRKREEEETKQLELETNLDRRILDVTGRPPTDRNPNFFERNEQTIIALGGFLVLIILLVIFLRGRK